jgi:hypothetical protein
MMIAQIDPRAPDVKARNRGFSSSLDRRYQANHPPSAGGVQLAEPLRFATRVR